MKLTQCFITKLFHFCLSQDHKAAFKSKTTMEVFRALVVFQLCGIKKLVDNNEMASCAKEKKKKKHLFFLQLMKLGQRILGKNLFGEVMKRTFYGHFVAGPVFSCKQMDYCNFLTLKPGHSGDRSNDRPDAELWREEHSGLQRGGGHQPGGSGTARE